MGERFLLNLRTRVYAHVQGLSSHALDGRRLGDVLQRLTSDVQAIESFVLSGIGDGISAVLRILFFGGALFLLSWQLALVSLVVTPLFFLAARHFSRLSKHAAREKRRRSGSLGAVAEESLGNAALVQALGREADEVARFRAEGERIVEAELAATRIRGLFSPIVDLIELVGVLIVVGLGTWALTAGPAHARRAARLPRVPVPALRAGARPRRARQPDVRGGRGRRAGARAARGAPGGDGAARRAARSAAPAARSSCAASRSATRVRRAMRCAAST